ncbi:MAG: hypothetical protein NUV82_01775 [Candidatus Komeilibacteria bacterium]|nr:hypothetical protein [Candidatus Komeilibacteria bacterium]
MNKSYYLGGAVGVCVFVALAIVLFRPDPFIIYALSVTGIITLFLVIGLILISRGQTRKII